LSSSDIWAIVLLVFLPSVVFVGLIVYMRTDHYRRLPVHSIYKTKVFGYPLVLNTQQVLQLALLVVAFMYVERLASLREAILIAVLAGLAMIRFERLGTSELTDTTERLLAALDKWQKDVGEVRQHVEALQYDVVAKQSELDEKERIRKKLDDEIFEKEEEARIWAEMSEEQKEQFLKVTVSALQKNSRSSFLSGLVLGFLMNLLATLTWTMLGNPGRDEVVKAFVTLLQRPK
jgi:hypothetical protein